MEEKETVQKNKLSKGKKVLIVILVILYTAAVSLVSSVVTKAIIDYKENKIIQEKIEELKKEQEEATTGANVVNIELDGDSEETTVEEITTEEAE